VRLSRSSSSLALILTLTLCPTTIRAQEPAAPQEAQPAPEAGVADPGSQSPPGAPMPLRASTLSGLPLLAADDAPLGSVRDLLIEPTGDALLIVERESDRSLVGLPLTLVELRLDPEDQQPVEPDASPRERARAEPRIVGLSLRRDAERLASAPSLEASRSASIDGPWVERSRQHWTASSTTAPPARAPDQLHPDGRPYSDSLPGVQEGTGAGAQELEVRSNFLLRASALSGAPLLDTEGERAGSIEDVLLDLPAGAARSLLVATRGDPSARHALSVASLQVSAQRGELVYATERSALAAAPSVGPDELELRAGDTTTPPR
jgi:uncharacterized protein YrrD